MKNIIDRPRYGCALAGALAVLRTLPRVIPIVHASAGCGYNAYNGYNAGSGYLGGGYCGGTALPSSNVVEKEVVFGGEERLREQIEATLEIMDGDLYVVVTGCTTEMIGDDIDSVVAEFQKKNIPILAISTPSFQGNSYYGYDLVLNELVKQYMKKSVEKKKNKVNILGVIPGGDVFWKGNLREIKRLLNKIGIEVNTFFGELEGLSALKNGLDASLNIVLSPIYGEKVAKMMKVESEISYIKTSLPVGYLATERFLYQVGESLTIERQTIDQALIEEQEVYFDYLERVSDIYNDIDLQQYGVIVGDATNTIALTNFLYEELGYLPILAIITDIIPKEKEKEIRECFIQEVQDIVVFEKNTAVIEQKIKEQWSLKSEGVYKNQPNPAIILGSVLEREVAAEVGAYFLSVTFPITNRVVMSRCYAGIQGGLTLTEDLLSVLVAGR